MESQFPPKTPALSVSATLSLVAFGLQPEAVTDALGIEPSHTDVRYVRRCGTDRQEECALWSYDSASQISSDDLREHIEHLLGRFRPLKSRIEGARPRPNVFINLRCKPIDVAALLLAPQIEAVHVVGLADLGAALKFEFINPRKSSA
jgi:hypothetical protein